jgi:hypothetical protein
VGWLCGRKLDKALHANSVHRSSYLGFGAYESGISGMIYGSQQLTKLSFRRREGNQPILWAASHGIDTGSKLLDKILIPGIAHLRQFDQYPAYHQLDIVIVQLSQQGTYG